MLATHSDHAAALLSDGQVLIAGGADEKNEFLAGVTAELFEPASGTFVSTGGLAVPRQFCTTTVLPSGGVLVTGGLVDDYAVTATAEIYK